MPPEEEKSQKPLIITGIVIVVVFMIAIGLVVKFKPQWLGGKVPDLKQYMLTTKKTSGNLQTAATPVNPDAAFTTPPPTPDISGPGPYACDPLGFCNRYDDNAKNSGCPRTFYDANCLNRCGDKAVQCTKL